MNVAGATGRAQPSFERRKKGKRERDKAFGPILLLDPEAPSPERLQPIAQLIAVFNPK
jgi:hypothetical protein